nr:hypothetical protein [Clostridium sp.]
AGVLSRENSEVAKALLIQSLDITVDMEICVSDVNTYEDAITYAAASFEEDE